MGPSPRAMNTNDPVGGPDFAALIRLACSSIGISSRRDSPWYRLLRFGKVLSSTQTAATPARSNSRTVRTTLESPPKPLSQSTTTGSRVAPSILAVAARVSVIVIRLRSGIAWVMVETPKPLTHTASKPYASISCAVIASCAPTAITGDGDVSPSLSASLLPSGGSISSLLGARPDVAVPPRLRQHACKLPHLDRLCGGIAALPSFSPEEGGRPIINRLAVMAEGICRSLRANGLTAAPAAANLRRPEGKVGCPLQ